MLKVSKIVLVIFLIIVVLNSGKSTADTRAEAIDECKLAKIVREPLSAGFPREPSLIPSTGKVRNLFLFVDFPDNPSKISSEKFANNYFRVARKFFETISYGKFTPELAVSTKVFRVKNHSASYKMFTDGQGDYKALVQDSLNAADDEIDFSEFDIVTVLPPANTKQIRSSGAITGESDHLKTNDRNFSSAIIIGGNKLSSFNEPGFGWSFYAHEFGHVLGLTHPFKNTEGEPGPIWDLMGNGGTSVPEFIGWHRLVLKWLADEEVICLSQKNDRTIEQTLIPLNSRNIGKKLLIAPLNTKQALVVEVRRKSSFDRLTPKETGVLVYLVDVTKGDDEGIVTVISSKRTTKDSQILGSLKPGEKVIYRGITIQVVSSNRTGDRIKVIRS